MANHTAQCVVMCTPTARVSKKPQLFHTYKGLKPLLVVLLPVDGCRGPMKC